MRTVLALLLVCLAGCAARPVAYEPLVAEAYPQPAAVPADGAIFHPGQGGGLFEDRRARRVGDLVTVLLVERTQAQKSASTTTSRDSSTSIPAPSLFGRALSSEGNVLGATELGGENSFEGTGDASQSNRLEGQLSVVVTEVYANGMLRVAGEKRLELNKGTERLRVSGLVRQEDIGPDNTVPSSRVAMADISYSGSGPVSESNSMGWLTRFFQSPLWPF